MMDVGCGRVRVRVVVQRPPGRLSPREGPEEEICIDVVLHAFETLLEVMPERVHGPRQTPAYHAELIYCVRSFTSYRRVEGRLYH